VRPTIVIGSDGTAQSDGALRFGGALAQALGARVIVATAYHHSPPLRGDRGSYDAIMHDDAAKIAREGAVKVKGVTDVQAAVTSGASVAEALHHVAEAERADLLVVATSARRRIAGHQPGSLPERVVHHSPCPVAVVPLQEHDPRFERIGVAVDGTPAARTALEYAYRLADRAGGESPKLRLLHVSPVPGAFAHVPQPGLPAPAPAPGLDAERLDRIAADAAAHGEADVVEHTGDPAEELVRLSEGLDVLVCGSRDQGALKRLVLGSVSTHVVRHATCPVIVVSTSTGVANGGVTASAEPAGA
jgi:nucleotide-binding universal stress UspA family protein